MILVLNCGSSSLKYRLVDPAAGVGGPAGGAGRGGVMERIGEPDGDAPDHATALRRATADLDLAGVTAVGHRVVHGGTRFREPTRVDAEVRAGIAELIPLAPLHNPANLTGIEVAQEVLPDVPHVAVFDTAFHATLPAAAAAYAIDAELAARHGIRRYGFHGTSHRYVARRCADLLGRPITELNLIVLHLGNGASATAVAAGRSVETSMGLSPLEGLVMGTRSGDLDPAVPGYLHRVAGLGFAEVDELLQHRSGLVGLCGDNDLRTVLRRRDAGDAAAALAVDLYCHRIRKYVGAYHAVLGRLDAIAFTAGVGEHAPAIRAEALAGLAPLGIAVDDRRNGSADAAARVISPGDARVTVCVVPTDEEAAIAEEVAELLAGDAVADPTPQPRDPAGGRRI
ncbi:MAG TPA: acetate/propionate family kinase [Micromonosporaceae bacterium]|nr:acetate/propionate family kinase [Micromonosporaceae bacterium]